MRLYFEKITEEGRLIEFSDNFSVGDTLYNNVGFTGQIYPVGDSYILSGDLSATISDKCDRCVEVFDEKVSAGIVVEITRIQDTESSEEEKELSDDDMGLYFVEEDYIDLEEIIAQESVLLRPIKRLCFEDCKGLCPVCGTNLNFSSCNCNEGVDDRWSVLKQLLENKK
jgi:uncharacterized protein